MPLSERVGMCAAAPLALSKPKIKIKKKAKKTSQSEWVCSEQTKNKK
jgi:hypothetical protein